MEPLLDVVFCGHPTASICCSVDAFCIAIVFLIGVYGIADQTVIAANLLTLLEVINDVPPLSPRVYWFWLKDSPVLIHPWHLVLSPYLLPLPPLRLILT